MPLAPPGKASVSSMSKTIKYQIIRTIIAELIRQTSQNKLLLFYLLILKALTLYYNIPIAYCQISCNPQG